MESSLFEMMIVPVGVATIELLAGCWAVSKVTGWLGRCVRAVVGHGEAPEDPRDPLPNEWESSGSFDDRGERRHDQSGRDHRKARQLVR